MSVTTSGSTPQQPETGGAPDPFETARAAAARYGAARQAAALSEPTERPASRPRPQLQQPPVLALPDGVRPAVAASGVTKVFGSGETAVHALAGVDVTVAPGSFTAIMGPSGSGKSTLMHCLAGLDTVTSGSIRIGDAEITSMSDKALTLLRRDRVGFVFQSFNLLPMLTAKQNILLPVELSGSKPDKEWFGQVVGVLGIEERLGHKPAQLSGGQQQRVACARALLGRPQVVFADEPTGNLDSQSGAEVLGFLRRSVREMGQTIVMVTHDPNAAAYADRVLLLADGKVAGGIEAPTSDSVLDALRVLGG